MELAPVYNFEFAPLLSSSTRKETKSGATLANSTRKSTRLVKRISFVDCNSTSRYFAALG